VIIQLKPRMSKIVDEETKELRDIIDFVILPDNVSPKSVISTMYDGNLGKWLVEVGKERLKTAD